MQVGRRQNLNAHPSVRTSRVCRNPKSDSDAADKALEDLKRRLAKPPVLAAPGDKEPLLLYVAANTRAVSVAIVVERKEAGKEYPVQRPVYYISEVLIESKQRYPHW